MSSDFRVGLYAALTKPKQGHRDRRADREAGKSPAGDYKLATSA